MRVERTDRARVRSAIEAAFLALAAATLASCPEPVYEGFEGTLEDPVEISKITPHAGYIGFDVGRNCSYYTFVSDESNPSVVYEHVWPDDDLDCYVYTDSDFYHGEVAVNEAISETTCIVQPGDFTGVRLYVKIVNYTDTRDLEFDIYYY